MSTKPKILITTPHGHTGAPAVEALLRRGLPVRALVRKDDARAARLRERGVEVVVGNLFDWRDVRRAVDGVQRAYHCPPFGTGHLHNTMLMALAAEDAGLEVVALMSGWNPHASHPSIHQREHWIANNMFRRLRSVDVIHINPGLFAFAYLLGLPGIVHFGLLAGPWGEGRNAPPSNEDIGRVAAACLTEPVRFVGRCLRPTGPKLITPSDIADTLTRVVGRKVTYRDTPPQMLVKAATAQGFERFQIAQIRHYAEELRQGTYAKGAPTDHVREATGVEPEDFETIARRYVQRPELIFAGLRAGSFLSSVALMLRTLLTRAPDLDRWEQAQTYPLINDWTLAHDSPQWVKAAEAGSLVLLPDPPNRQPSAPHDLRPAVFAG